MTTWQIQEAKNKLSELIERALAEGPQVITRHGVEVVVVVPFARYRKMTEPKARMGQLLLNSPLRDSGIVIERDRSTRLRAIDIE